MSTPPTSPHAGNSAAETVHSGEINGLDAAIDYADNLGTYCLTAHDGIAAVTPDPDALVQACQQSAAALHADGVRGDTLASVHEVQSSVIAAAQAVRDAMANWEIAAAAAQKLRAGLRAQTSVQDAYSGSPDAGSREFLTGEPTAAPGSANPASPAPGSPATDNTTRAEEHQSPQEGSPDMPNRSRSDRPDRRTLTSGRFSKHRLPDPADDAELQQLIADYFDPLQDKDPRSLKDMLDAAPDDQRDAWTRRADEIARAWGSSLHGPDGLFRYLDPAEPPAQPTDTAADTAEPPLPAAASPAQDPQLSTEERIRAAFHELANSPHSFVTPASTVSDAGELAPAPGPVSTEQRIRDAVRQLAAEPGDFVRIAKVRELVGDDVDPDEVTRVLSDLARADPDVQLANAANAKALTDADRAGALKVGSEERHLIAIQPPCIDGAADHVRAIGVANASDQELEHGLYAPEARSQLIEEIRAEQSRRRQAASAAGLREGQQTPRTALAPAEPVSTEDRVRDAVAKLATEDGGWVGLVDVRKALPDVDHDEVSRVLRDMSRTDLNVHLVPEDNRKALAPEDHAAAVTVGGEEQHVISIERPRDPAAKDRVQAAGIGNATDDDLALALRDPLLSTRTHDEIRAEQKRRASRPHEDVAPATVAKTSAAAERSGSIEAAGSVPSAAAIAARLREAATVEQGANYLAEQKLDRDTLRAVAAELGMTRIGRLSDTKLRERILNQAIAARNKYAGLRNW
ncbi:hypothetical protein [Amycolatopsis australiensis]|uniref:Uncharacterized protein n=1 Tax=Amycolatopsis australiensis TaxID=546364 RepID=A0A1K1LKY5_9PSEU|nr:hypothetical protein [Amycolatopsis australiensis]SFW11565.1 hypothetical protein SAMN04489730_0033 [Amycolatopsis australiensis]